MTDETRIRTKALWSMGAPVVVMAAAMAVVGSISGCRSDDASAARPREVTLAEFARPAGDEPEVEGSGQVLATEEGEFALGAGNEGLDPVVFDRVSDSVVQPGDLAGDRVIIDSLIGQVNGRPIFADEFFEPIEDELIASAQRLDERDFAAKANELVHGSLQQLILNELFLSEAEGSLTNEQQQGLLAWLDNLKENIISQEGGVKAETERQMLLEEGVTLDEYLDSTKKLALIAQLLDQKIRPRVIVSWRDIEREYERRYAFFNPPARITLARIRLSNGRSAELIEEVTTRLAAGEPFQEIAVSIDQWTEGGWQAFDLGAEGVAGIELHEDAVAALVGLEVGETSESFQIGTSTWWLNVVSLEQPPGRSLYDPAVQQGLANDLHARRSAEERQAYIESLLEGGIYDEVNDMADRLLIIALLRYGRS